jgi:hypothetical protein
MIRFLNAMENEITLDDLEILDNQSIGFSNSISSVNKDGILDFNGDYVYLKLPKETIYFSFYDIVNCMIEIQNSESNNTYFHKITNNFLTAFENNKYLVTPEEIQGFWATVCIKIMKRWYSYYYFEAYPKDLVTCYKMFNQFFKRVIEEKKKEELKINDSKNCKFIGPEPKNQRRRSIIISHESNIPFLETYRDRNFHWNGFVNLKKLYDLDNIHKKTTGQDINIALLYEEGIDKDHYLVKNQLKDIIVWKKESEYKDYPSHGTSVGSVVTQIAPDVQMSVYKTPKIEYPIDLIDLFRIKDTIDIMNISSALNVSGKNGKQSDWFDHKIFWHWLSTAVDLGRLIVKSAGNDNDSIRESIIECAKSKELKGRMIIVGSVMYDSDGNEFKDDTVTALSTTDPFICAPGKNILTACPNDNRHEVSNGTSLAAPTVTGTLALLMRKFPLWKEQGKQEKYIELILKSARKYYLRKGKISKDHPIGKECGQGILDIQAAFELAEQWAKDEE